MTKLTTTVEPTIAVAVSPELRQTLENSLAMYEMYREALDKEKALINTLLEESGVAKIEASTHTVYITSGGTSSSLDKKKLVALGVSEATIDMATTRKPKKPFLTIRKKGEKGDDRDDA